MENEIIDKLKNSNLVVGVAGPGAGKTYTFKKIIESEQYKGKKILILSFINKLVTDLENEFINFSNVEVRTLHGFANKFLGDVEMVENLDKIIREDYLHIKNIDFNFEESLCKNNLSTTENTETFSFYKERKKFYSKNKKIYSFNSSILAVNMLFENSDLIPYYDLILVDEFQDFNQLEYALISNLNLKSKLIIVGDDDQSLYGFKHAKPALIRMLYSENDSEKFSLDYCRRCTAVIVKAVNNLVSTATQQGFLKERITKSFLYPYGENKSKDELSSKNDKIDFICKLKGAKLIYELSNKIEKDMLGVTERKRILILAPKFYHQTLYNGLLKKGFNVVEYELFSSERNGNHSHYQIINSFSVLEKTKTNNLNLRILIDLYLNKTEVKSLLLLNGNIWNNLSEETKHKIEVDINLFRKIRKGSETLNEQETLRLNKLFNLKNVISKMVTGFDKLKTKAVEVEIVTAMSSKGLSADFVYYLHIDDKILFGSEGKISDDKICEFLVGVTRAKEKLTLISTNDESPTILTMLGMENIRIVKS